MSYSFTVKAKTKDDAKKAVIDQMTAIVGNQPTHKADADAVIVVAHEFIDILGDPHEGEEVHVSVNGSLSWQAVDEFTGANVSVQANLKNA